MSHLSSVPRSLKSVDTTYCTVLLGCPSVAWRFVKIVLPTSFLGSIFRSGPTSADNTPPDVQVHKLMPCHRSW